MIAPLLALAAGLSQAAEKKNKEAPLPLMTSFVQSDEWRIRRSPVKEEEFIGNVRYRARSNELRSDWALFKHAEKTWRARGHVHAEHLFANGDRLEALGENALFDMKTEKGSLTGRAHEPIRFSRTPEEGDRDLGEAGRLEWQGRQRFDLLGDVHFWGTRFEAWSDRAHLEADTRTALLTGGRPVLRNAEAAWSGAVKADRIAAAQTPEGGRRVNADGRVKGWIEYRKAAKPKEAPAP